MNYASPNFLTTEDISNNYITILLTLLSNGLEETNNIDESNLIKK